MADGTAALAEKIPNTKSLSRLRGRSPIRSAAVPPRLKRTANFIAKPTKRCAMLGCTGFADA